MNNKQKLLIENKELFGDIKDLNNLDDYAIEERFLKYGNWKNIKELINIYGSKKLGNFTITLPTCNDSENYYLYFNPDVAAVVPNGYTTGKAHLNKWHIIEEDHRTSCW